LYSGQFITAYFALGNLSRRSALNLCGITDHLYEVRALSLNEVRDPCNKLAPDLYALEPQWDEQLWKGLPIRTSRCYRSRRVGGKFARQQADGQEAADALVPPWSVHAHTVPDGRSERRASRSVMSTVPTAATERASYLQDKAAPSAGCLTPENLPSPSRTSALLKIASHFCGSEQV
jgi:hypothetical protein